MNKIKSLMKCAGLGIFAIMLSGPAMSTSTPTSYRDCTFTMKFGYATNKPCVAGAGHANYSQCTIDPTAGGSTGQMYCIYTDPTTKQQTQKMAIGCPPTRDADGTRPGIWYYMGSSTDLALCS